MRTSTLKREIRDGVYAYISSPTPTICAVPDQYYFIEGEFTNEVLECWEITPPLTYLGYCSSQFGRLFEISVHASLTSNTNNSLVTIALIKNGNLQVNSQMCTFIKNTSQEYSVSLVDVIFMEPGDNIEIHLKSSVISEITANKMTTSLKRFF